MVLKLLVCILMLSSFPNDYITNFELATPPPPNDFPAEKDSLQVIGKITFNTKLSLLQDFTPQVPKIEPPLIVSLRMKVENNSKKKMKDFKIEKLTLYYDGTPKQLVTVNLYLISEVIRIDWNQISPGESKEYSFVNFYWRDIGHKPSRRYEKIQTISPNIKEGEKFYARLLLSWSGKTKTISTAPAEVEFMY